MFTVYHSNRLEHLADQLAAVVRQPPASPLASEIIIVQSQGMARWLSLYLAQQLGICANIRFPFPASFLWDMFRRVLIQVPETAPFAPEVLTWRLMEQLRTLEDVPRFAPLASYLGDDDDFRRFDLASRIADVFDQYLVYRPDWIVRWERGEEEHWQAELWRRLTAGDAPHRVRLQEHFLRALEPATVARAGLPARVSLIGIPAMPPVYLELLARLADFIEVHLFLLNPCRAYWGDIVADRDIARRAPAGDPEALYLETGNSLLASLGTLGRDFIDLILQSSPVQEVEGFEDPGEDSLLHCLQSDILNLRNRGTSAVPPTPLRPDDRSVQVHTCHSPMREMEVLHDQLLALFAANPDLQPADVVVMTPDIERYAPVIEAVFATGDRDRSIPFSVADRSLRAESPVVEAFFALLDLPESRYDTNRILALLEIGAVQRQFGLMGSDLGLVRRWLRETSICWGIDPDSRATLGLPPTRDHTWRAGLDRLLAGYALPGGNARLFADILPYDEVEGGDAQVMGRLQTLAEVAFRLATELRDRRPVNAWITTLSGVLERFLKPDETEEPDVQALRQALERIGQTAAQAAFAEPVSLEVMKSCLRRSLDVPERAGRFLTGGVTFCAMVPMRSIPFQVVCLIGMNYESYPRYFAIHDAWFVGARQVQKVVKRLANRAQIAQDVTPHVLRHTFATLALQKGISLAAIQKILGHDRLSTTAIYLNLTDTHVIEEYAQKW